MNWLKALWAKPIVQTTVEHMIRGGIAAVAAAYLGGDLVLSVINVDTFNQALGLFLSGAVASLLMALGVNAKTGTGPAVNKYESYDGQAPAEDGQANIVYLLLAVLLILIIFFWFVVPALR